MSDPTSERDGESSGATATMAPPKPPSSPPRTAAAAPGPAPKRGRGCLIAGVLAIVVVLFALGGFVWWSVLRPGAGSTGGAAGGSAIGSAAEASAFASAMRKAGVTAPPAPKSPVDLVSVKTNGGHPFQATFTPDELAALLRAFTYTPTSGMRVQLSVQSLSQTGGTSLRLTGDVNASGTSYSGWIEGPVSFANRKIVSTGPVTANTGGLQIGGAQAAQAAGVLLGYLNSYVGAAPGLTVGSAAVTTAGVRVTGSAPDSITW